MRRFAAIFLLCAFLASAITTRSWSQSNCPANTLVCVESTTTSTDPQGACNAGWNYGGANCSYDATRGTVGAGFCCNFGWGSAQVVDDFVISNLPPGTPLTFRATLYLGLQCSGYSHGSGACNGSMTGPDGATVRYGIDACCGQGNSASHPLDLAVQALAGQTFRITYQVEAEADEGGFGSASGQFIFQDLPPGATIQSCHGYVEDFPVPAKPMSWGRVKVLYR
jgi:hypothetical protein